MPLQAMPIQDLYDGQAAFPLPWPMARAGRGGLSAAVGGGWGPELTVLMALGMAHRRPLTQQDLMLALESLDLPTVPCADVVWGLLRGLIRSEALRPDPGAGDALIPGAQAMRQLTRGMAAPLEGGGGILRAVIRARMAFLDLLAPADRVRALERMLLALEVSAEGVSSGFEESWSGSWGNRWILRDLAAATDDIRQLRSLLDEARAAERRSEASPGPAGASQPASALLYAAE
ncbi:hypothetical protein [Novispirillum itersonii]|uniref:Uncharacterized protein n=1 Tax=Novispirillum itersonii TaxID=189 RepID=A0A7W9ZCZ0_NOVIT|nr:hypothetical protein [Novispirillum itersonii]MBB6209213.1 hypothetical protein [Novispirillum itersonii]